MSIKKVAKMAGVSIATVSRFFNNPSLVKHVTREKVERASKHLNYRPNTLAQNFRRGKTGIILLVVYSISDPLDENFSRTVTQIAQSKGYDVLIKETNHQTLNAEYYRDILNSKQADGLIVMIDLPRLDKTTQLALNQLPIIFIKGEAIATGLSKQYIGLDNYAAAQTATNHLIDLGHQTIACITTDINNTSSACRNAGFLLSMKKAKLASPQVISLSTNTRSMANTIKTLLLSSPKVTAIFCTSDDLAIDALSELKQQNIRIPDELSIIGFDNIRYAAKTSPALSTIELPLNDIAQQAIKTLFTIINDDNYPIAPRTDSTEVTFRHRIILRSSTAKPYI
ncbi:MAG: LacI family repressor for deo operon, udp, cdd, tsx, nupC, and nupG [Candidatus Endobugula sp.]|jgi:LacI family repressor for deo operon, udp, cdd, tsx, nupC, and nupG